MRCKVGDLAIVIKGRSGKNDGKIVRVVRIANHNEEIGPYLARVKEHEKGEVSWLCHGENLYTGLGEGPLRAWVFRDKVLRPIRDPGPDAVDETLEWLKVPSKEGHPA